MSVINTNTKSLIAQNALTVNNRSLSNTMQQLSTGKRINSAADDAAGLSIASKMTSQIRGLDQAVRNGNDGISLLQTAEGAMIEMTNMLQRMREVAVQSANDTNTADDRTNLDNEFQQLKKEITRIGENTQWNGMGILNASDEFGADDSGERTVKFQVGANQNQTIDINMKNFTFTPSETAPEKSVATVSFTAAEGAVAKMVASFGDVDVEITLETALSAAPDADAIEAAAADIQAKLNKYVGLESVKVTSTGTVMTITDGTGKEIDGLEFQIEDGTADDTVEATIANGETTDAEAPDEGGVFTADLAGATLGTTELANDAIGYVDTAITAINTERSKIGATINRLSYAVDNLSQISQNTSESRSRIQDTDYAKATTELARTQIIQQAATAMLAQANQSGQSVLALLK